MPGVERLRFVTSYPRDFTQPMIDALGALRLGRVEEVRILGELRALCA